MTAMTTLVTITMQSQQKMTKFEWDIQIMRETKKLNEETEQRAMYILKVIKGRRDGGSKDGKGVIRERRRGGKEGEREGDRTRRETKIENGEVSLRNE